MKSREIARRYAEALYDLGYEDGLIAAIEAAYGGVVAAIAATPDAVRFLDHPLVPRARKIAFLDAAFPDLPEYLRNLFRLLVRNGRAGYIRAVYEEFRILHGIRARIARVKVTTAKPLSPQDRKRLTNHLAAALGSKVELEERVEPSLLGGARLEIDDKVIDGTLRARLARLRAVLAG